MRSNASPPRRPSVLRSLFRGPLLSCLAQRKVIMGSLPGFADNITRGLAGRFWVGFTKPRSAIIDRFAGHPFVRRMFARLPRVLFPIPPPFGHVIAFDVTGRVVGRHQDANPKYPETTGATEIETGLYVHSLTADSIGFLDRSPRSKPVFTCTARPPIRPVFSIGRPCVRTWAACLTVAAPNG